MNRPEILRRIKIIAIWTILLGVGLLHMTADLLNWPVVKGVAMASAMSPAPKVFSSHRGLETYSTRFFLEWTDTQDQAHSLELTPQVYAQVGGPYNRRNTYGAVLAYGPIMPEEMRNPIMQYAVCGQAPLLRELGIDPATIQGPMTVRLVPLEGTDLGDLPTSWTITCR